MGGVIILIIIVEEFIDLMVMAGSRLERVLVDDPMAAPRTNASGSPIVVSTIVPIGGVLTIGPIIDLLEMLVISTAVVLLLLLELELLGLHVVLLLLVIQVGVHG